MFGIPPTFCGKEILKKFFIGIILLLHYLSFSSKSKAGSLTVVVEVLMLISVTKDLDLSFFGSMSVSQRPLENDLCQF